MAGFIRIGGIFLGKFILVSWFEQVIIDSVEADCDGYYVVSSRFVLPSTVSYQYQICLSAQECNQLILSH